MTDGARQRVVGGRYALEALIATGGMGQVWRGRDTLLDRPVAVKLLRAEYGADETVRARFRTEARLAGRLTHRNIAALYDYGEQPGDDGAVCAHLVMQLVDGEPLSTLLAREGALPPDRVLDLVGQTAQGLAVAHAAGVVHRDVKPGNLLVGRDGVVRVTDFGIAWSAASAPLTRTDQVVGTAHYLSPEQAGAGRPGPASDVYALGMVAWECLAGRRAFDGTNPVQIALMQLREDPPPLPRSVPAPVRQLVARMVAKDPAARPADGAALSEAVAAVRAGRALPPAPPPRTSPLPLPAAATPRPRRRGVRVLGVAATLAAGAALGVGALTLAGPPAPPDVVAGVVPAGVEVRRAELLGRPADEVEDALVAAGLRVVRGALETADAVPGSVLGVTPVGRLAAGDLVTLTVATAPPSPPPSPPPTVAAPAPAAPSRAPWTDAPRSDAPRAPWAASRERTPEPEPVSSPTEPAPAVEPAAPTAEPVASGTPAPAPDPAPADDEGDEGDDEGDEDGGDGDGDSGRGGGRGGRDG